MRLQLAHGSWLGEELSLASAPLAGWERAAALHGVSEIHSSSKRLWGTVQEQGCELGPTTLRSSC